MTTEYEGNANDFFFSSELIEMQLTYLWMEKLTLIEISYKIFILGTRTIFEIKLWKIAG